MTPVDDLKPAPVFDIAVGRSGHDTSIRVNGQDISADVQALTVQVTGGELTKITLLVFGHKAHVTVQGAIEHVAIVDRDGSVS